MNEAIFLDRDGVVIEDVDHLYREDQIKFIDGADEIVKSFNDLGYLVFIVTNQPVVAYGLVSEEDVRRINDKIVSYLERAGGRITRVYYCPHHPNANVEAYRTVCECRKPSPGMLLEAGREYAIDMERSYMIGDRISDIITGREARCRTILIETPLSYKKISGKDYDLNTKPDFTVKTLAETIEILLVGNLVE